MQNFDYADDILVYTCFYLTHGNMSYIIHWWENKHGCYIMQHISSCSSNKKTILRDFRGGPVVKNLPSNARDAESIPDWGTKIPHAMGK